LSLSTESGSHSVVFFSHNKSANNTWYHDTSPTAHMDMIEAATLNSSATPLVWHDDSGPQQQHNAHRLFPSLLLVGF
jgi:hypothetical protein